MTVPRKYLGLIRLVSLFVLAPVALWYLSIGDAVRLAAECRRLERRIDVMSGRTKTDSAPLYIDNKELVMSGELLTVILPFAAKNGVRVGDYAPSVTLRQGAAEVHTASLTMSGTFSSILRTIYRIETDVPSCKPVSLHFGIVSPSNGRDNVRLEATLYLEQLIKTDNR